MRRVVLAVLAAAALVAGGVSSASAATWTTSPSDSNPHCQAALNGTAGDPDTAAPAQHCWPTLSAAHAEATANGRVISATLYQLSGANTGGQTLYLHPALGTPQHCADFDLRDGEGIARMPAGWNDKTSSAVLSDASCAALVLYHDAGYAGRAATCGGHGTSGACFWAMNPLSEDNEGSSVQIA